MRKIILIVLVLLCCGCNVEDAKFFGSSRSSESVILDQNIEVVEEVEQLVSLINNNILNNQFSTYYTADKKFDIDDIIRMLSYVLPFDIKVKQYQLHANQEEYAIEVEFIDEDSKKCIAEAKRIIKENISADMSVDDKVKFVHDYIIQRCEYDESIKSRTNDNAEAFQVSGVLFNEKAVCSGYSRCFLLFMRLLDIPCLYIPSDVINHSFNLIYDGNYKFVDTTWDEGENRYYGLDITTFFSDGNHEMDIEYNRNYFMNFIAKIYQLGV